MVLNLKDCADLVNVLHPEYNYIFFLFDHSCGNDRKRLDSLGSISVRKEYRGNKEPKMRATKIELNKYLGPFAHKITVVQVGSIQRMHLCF